MKPKRAFVPRKPVKYLTLSYVEFFEDGYNYYLRNGKLRDFTSFTEGSGLVGWRSLKEALKDCPMFELTGQELLEFEAEWVLKR